LARKPKPDHIDAERANNFNYYPPAVTQVIAVEPEPYLSEKARSAAAQAPVAIKLLDGRCVAATGRRQLPSRA
jgi:hypothetical protein